VLNLCTVVLSALAGEGPHRVDLEAVAPSGIFDLCIEGVVAFASRGVEGLPGTCHITLGLCIGLLTKTMRLPGCEAKIRGVAKPLAFCLENSLDAVSEMGSCTGSSATKLCA
jgi:hypothetical protein